MQATHCAKRTILPTQCITEFELKQLLGEGASGLIYRAQYQNQQSKVSCDVAVKIFKGKVTSGDYPNDELKTCLNVGHHPNVVKTTSKIESENQTGLVMELIPQGFFNLGLPPTFKICTRDTFKKGFTLSAEQIQKIIHAILDVLNHLYSKQLSHGNLSAHNILIDEANTLLSDFGVASPLHTLPKHQQQALLNIEERALNYLIEDLTALQKRYPPNTTQNRASTFKKPNH
ncbi:MAG: protein kinase [Pseudomonadota bacterium]|nr:protein kinase [Pseudomonadota bacterium]